MALPINIDDLINVRTVESTRMEFKKGWNPEEVLRSMCAFANDLRGEGGGYIIIGIEEKDGSPILPPYGLNQNQIDPIQKEFLNLCFKIKENIFPVIEPVTFQGKNIIVIWVTPGESKPYRAPSTLGQKGEMRIYVRPLSATIPATAELERQLREMATFKHFDDRINERATMADLDLGLIQAYLQEVKSNLYEESTKLPLEQIAIKMQIARGPSERVRPLNVGLLMFCKEPHRFFDGCVTNLVEFEDEGGTKYVEKRFTGPVHTQIRDIMSYINGSIIKQHVNKPSNIAESDSFYNYPYAAIEEAVTNALYHRSYENPTPTEIRIYKSFSKGMGINEDTRRIEIHSYPGALPPINEEALAQLRITARNYRNIKLGDWLKNLRLAEKYATGIPTMVQSLARNGSPMPILSMDKDRSYFLAVIKIHESTPLESFDSNHDVQAVKLSNIQQQILEHLLQTPSLDQELIDKFGSEVTQDIEFLKVKELIAVKTVGDLRILHITPLAIAALNQSF